MVFQWSYDVPLSQNFFFSFLYVFVFQKKKKKSNCPTLLKKVCCVQYNLPHHPLKVTVDFEWSCGIFLCQNSFPCPLCVCVFVSKKKKSNNQKIIKKFHYYIDMTLIKFTHMLIFRLPFKISITINIFHKNLKCRIFKFFVSLLLLSPK